MAQEAAGNSGSFPGRLLRRAGKAVLKVIGGAVYYAIYRKLPDTAEPNPYWSEMHPDDDKGAAGEDRQHLAQSPPAI